MRSLEDLLAASSWAQGLTPGQLQRVRTTTVVRDFAAEAHVCHAGDPANIWIGVVDGLVRMVSLSSSGKWPTFAALLIKVDYRMITVLDLEGLRRFGDRPAD
jgi:CRP/FNR family transcriptional regulator, cyclic AMP receptor protein